MFVFPKELFILWTRESVAGTMPQSPRSSPMLAPTSSPDAGSWLRAARERLRLSTRDVERLSYEIALERSDKQYYVSHSWLTDIENGRFRPGVLKLHTLSVIYHGNYDEFLALLGIPVGDAGRKPSELLLPHTHLLRAKEDAGKTIIAPIELRDNVQLKQTNLMARMFEGWGEVPVALLQQMDLRNSLYGYIGKEDYTLYPVIRPASFVQIDPRQTKITPGNWHSDFDRPIYFFELRDKYVCSWCELDGSQLILIPSSQSRLPARHIRFPGDAEILGRVIGVTMRIAEMAGDQSKESSAPRPRLGGRAD
jgi:transcriptional regulator with XRE-family HTH domain